jgi:hypothetical protein
MDRQHHRMWEMTICESVGQQLGMLRRVDDQGIRQVVVVLEVWE